MRNRNGVEGGGGAKTQRTPGSQRASEQIVKNSRVWSIRLASDCAKSNSCSQTWSESLIDCPFLLG